MSEEFKIEKGIPAPAHRRLNFPFKEMVVGDSVLVPDNSAVYAARMHGYRHNMKFKARKEGDKFRVWRTA